MRLEVPLIHVRPEERSGVSEPEVTLMDVDTEAVAVVSATAELSDPTPTEGRDVGPPPSPQPDEMSWMPSPDGPSELPGKKRRRVMFADG